LALREAVVTGVVAGVVTGVVAGVVTGVVFGAGVGVLAGVVVGAAADDEVVEGDGGLESGDEGPGGDPAATELVGELRGVEVAGSTPMVR
jgi:hypothetical protein